MMSKHFKIAMLVLCAVLSIVLVISIQINPFLFMPANVGSFEYIRMGERLVDKGKYVEAVKYYEKAFESSPESDIIRASLAWLYTVCAKEMTSSDSTGRAIYFLAKAYELRRNQATAQNLAMAYAKKAAEELRRNNWPNGIAACTKARDIAADYPNASSNLGIYLYNEAHNEFKADRDTVAVLLLSESFLAAESKYPFVLLGEIYYKRTDLEQAAFYWGKALQLDPENRSLMEKMDQVSKELALAKNQQKSQMPHFELRYDPKLQFDVQVVKDALEKAYQRTGKRLGYFPDEKAVVFLYSEEDFRNIFKLSPMVRAFYDGNIRMPLPSGSLAGDELVQYIEHEYTHAVLSAMTENNCPSWLGEGIAVSMQIKKDDPRIRDALLRAGDLSRISLDSIDGIFKDPAKDNKDVGAYYVVAYTMVQYITENFGDEALRGILKRLKSGQHFANAFDDQLLISEKEFVKRWSSYAEGKFLQNNK